ncbi:MAG: asparagine synthase (glutamine-hydrolyzing) [Bacteroidota bacterium]
MCGIIGHIQQRQSIDIEMFNAMRDTLYHRGPDGFGTMILNEGKVALGHRRLSIIDLSEDGKQPMSNEDGTIWLTFNGEIYNYVSLRQQLIKAGHNFQSKTDSEVLIHGYEEWGIQGLLNRIKGMFAFAIWDDDKQQLLMARDRFGIKPLYYHHDDTQFVFASEMKGITACPTVRKLLNPSAIADYFIYSYIPHPNSVWQSIQKLLPAHYLVYDKKSHQFKVKQYWKLTYSSQKIPDQSAIEQTNNILQKAVKEHLVSDVPVGLFLSGGYDSSALLMYMRQQEKAVSTFSLGFKDSERSEHQQAAAIAQRFEAIHNERVLSSDEDFLSLLQKLATHYDEPYATSSMLPYYYVSELAAQNHKVTLAGDGGDEAFGGYNWYYNLDQFLNRKRSYKWWIKQGWKGKKHHLLRHYYKSMTGAYRALSNKGILNADIVAQMKERHLWYYEQHYRPSLTPLEQFQNLDTHTFMLESCLVRADLSSMMHSLEVRVPFLDHEVFEFTARLHPDVYFKRGVKKHLLYENLKQQLHDGILNMPKRGFSFQHWMALQSRAVTDILNKGELSKHGILVRTIDATQLDGNSLFHLLMLEFWWQAHN